MGLNIYQLLLEYLDQILLQFLPILQVQHYEKIQIMEINNIINKIFKNYKCIFFNIIEFVLLLQI